jgi:catechol 2,3-dioxygenase-like lactoylglutathione lyase family enzyme
MLALVATSAVPPSEEYRDLMIEVRRIAWLGVRTDRADAMVAFLRDTLGMALQHADDGQWAFVLPDGGKTEVFSADGPYNAHFGRAPVAGFEVDDVSQAAEELRAAGVEIVHGPAADEEWDIAWVHFRAPDGNLYELTHGGDLEPRGATDRKGGD